MFMEEDCAEFDSCFQSVNHTKGVDNPNFVVINADLRILYLNARSKRNKLYDIELLVTGFLCEIDVLVLTEIWISEEENIFLI